MAKRVLLWLIGLGPLVVALLLPRESVSTSLLAGSAPFVGWRLVAAQALTATLGCSSLITIIQAWNDHVRRATALLVGFFLLFTGPIVSSILTGNGNHLQQLLMAPLVSTALFLASKTRTEQLVLHFRYVLRVYVWGSLASLLVAPDWATHYGDNVDALITHHDYMDLGVGRLAGLTPHPNALGPICAVSLAVEFARIGRKPWWVLHALVATATLMLTESRTGWFCVLALVCLHVRLRNAPKQNLHRWGVFSLCGAGLLAVVALVANGQQFIPDMMGRRDIMSLNGRTRVWKIALAEFMQSPLYGRGPMVFSPEYRENVIRDPTLMWAGQAHNQLFQTMATSGLLGLAGLVVFLYVILVLGRLAARRTAGLTLSLPIMLVIRGFTESPLEGLGAVTCNLMLVAMVLVLITSALDGHSDMQSPTISVPSYGIKAQPGPAAESEKIMPVQPSRATV
ncbi:O-antigen ligase family protein [Streptomyces sp. CA-142005]|uniref:O-antigen ligase family protein n=1 Tax=Streptomyces sp. CA-142005 TaxID=3240052 RepID=UPI003D8EAC0E